LKSVYAANNGVFVLILVRIQYRKGGSNEEIDAAAPRLG